MKILSLLGQLRIRDLSDTMRGW